MKKAATIILIVLFLTVAGVAWYDSVTGKVVIEEDPCRLIKCTVRLYGVLNVRAEAVGMTPDGLVICHCRHEPPEMVYLVSTYRKY